MIRKLADKRWLDRVPESAIYFLNGMVFLFVAVILYYFGGPPAKGPLLAIKTLTVAAIIGAINHFIFMQKKTYEKIIEFYENKYSGRPPWIAYFIVPACYILLMYVFSLIHSHYDYYYKMLELK
jgi:hypothetical protein